VTDCQDFDGDGVYEGSLPSSLTYGYSVSNQITFPGSDAGGITISAGTAYLYSQFRAGALAGVMSALSAEAQQTAFQQAIWILQGGLEPDYASTPWPQPLGMVPPCMACKS